MRGNLTEEGTRRRLTVDGATVSYHEAGSGDPILLLHSFGPRPGMTAWTTFGRVLPLLANEYWCLAMDLPNFGRSGPIAFDEPVHHMMARVAVGLLEQLGVDRCPVVGTSVGGTTAIDMAILYPERVAALVTGSCHISTGGDAYLLAVSPSEGSRSLAGAMERPGAATMRTALEALIHDPGQVTDDLVNELLARLIGAKEHRENIARSVNRPHSNLEAVSGLSLPALIVHGRDDRMIPVEQALMLLSHVRSAELVVLNRCGHWPPFERPAEYASHVLRFLRFVAPAGLS